MFTNIFIGFVVLFILAATPPVVARERWLERNNRAVLLHPRRFGQEQPGVIQQLSAACPGQVCGNLAVQAVTPLLAAQPECSQQDHADAIIDASRQFDAATQANMVALAKEYRQAEKNTPPDFSTNPPAARNSVFCQKAPKNLELNGLVQAQDPANDADLFFDPSTQATVRKGTQANTAPFSGAAAPRDPPVDAPAPTATTATALPDTAEECVTEVTVTVTGSNPAATGDATTFTVGDPITTAAPQNPTPPTNGSKIGNFGSCSVPQMEFGVGFDGRRETSFQPVDKVSYDHRSAQNHAIITHFICNTLVNKCGADQTARDTCATAKVAAAAAATGTGAQADAFNAVFGITTSFANIASVDNQGNVVSGTDDGRAPSATNGPSSNVASPTSATTVSSSAAATNTAISNGNGGNSGNNSGIGNFGQCSVPEIEFGTGFDGRRETSFQPADKASFNHGSAQNIDIIARAICDTLTSSCRADATVKATCATAAAAASAAPTKTGAQADAFNQVFGINTNFVSVIQIDDQGRAVGEGNGLDNFINTEPVPFAAVTTTAAAFISTQTPESKVPAITGSDNLQWFNGNLGDVDAPVVTATADGEFQVEGDAIFHWKQEALVCSCDIQNNECANAANASGNEDGFTVANCNDQLQECISVARSS